MSPSSPKTRCFAAVAALLVSSIAIAQTLRVDDAIKLRRAAFVLQGHYFSQLKPIASGQQAFDPAQARRLSSRLETLSQIPAEFFPVGSDKGDTKARPEIWSDASDFADKQRQSLADLAQLAAAAQAGDAEAFKARYLQAANSCKDCHESYRKR